MYWNLKVFLVLLESLWRVRFNRVYFTIFRAKVWKISIFEWILLLKIQTNCKNWVWKENFSWALNVFTLGPTIQVTLIYLLGKVICLFVVKISRSMHPLLVLFVGLGSPQWARVRWVGLIMFSHMVEKLLNIEYLKFTKKSFKSKLKIIREFGHTLDIVVKPSMSRIQWKWFQIFKNII